MKKKNLCLLAVLASGVLWGTIGVFNRYYGALGIESYNLVTLRLSMGTALLFLYLAIRDPQALKLKLKDLWIFAGAGILSIIMFQTCYMISIQHSEISIAAVLLYTSPLFVTIFSAIFFRDKITAKKIIGGTVTVVGCALASGIIGSNGIPTIALITGMLAGVGYASYSIWARAALNRGYKSITMTAYSFLFALVPLLFFADYGTIVTGMKSDGWMAIVMWILLALATEALPYLLYTESLTGMDMSKAAITVAIEPIVAGLIGICFYDEWKTMDWIKGLGMVLVIGSIVVMNLPKKEKQH
ncbi:MAG: EamA family transporter [Clostridia bacterium]|nr:EamA family transporter [Clostridia bacterium]